MRIDIFRPDLSYSQVEDYYLDFLIEKGQVFAFRRDDGWVIVDEGNIRRSSNGYTGPERRRKLKPLEENFGRGVSQSAHP